jgi:succinate--hydroxymethylglutarate CoA-transferase
VALNLKSPAGVDVLRRMASLSDIVIENFVPGKAAELGIGYEALSAINPRLIYCSLSGYGATGPDSDRLGYDVVISAEGGLMGITGEPNGAPVKCGVALTDVSTGLFLHGAILAALYSRTSTGRGQLLQTSLLETQASILVNAASAYLNGGVEGKRSGTAHPSIVPYQTFATADGHIMIAAGNDAQFRRLCERMRDAVSDDSLSALITDVKFATNKARVQHRNGAIWVSQSLFSTYQSLFYCFNTELIPRLSAVFLQLKTTDWMTALGGGREFPCAPINSLRAVFDQHPQVKHLQVVQEMPHPTAGHVRVVRTPVTFSGTAKFLPIHLVKLEFFTILFPFFLSFQIPLLTLLSARRLCWDSILIRC